MDGGRIVCLSLHPVQVDYLRASLEKFVSGLDDNIASHPEVPDLEIWRAECEVYRRMLGVGPAN